MGRREKGGIYTYMWLVDWPKDSHSNVGQRWHRVSEIPNEVMYLEIFTRLCPLQSTTPT